MNSREQILNKIRQSDRKPIARPDIDFPPITGDPVDNFTEKLTGFDGKLMLFDSRADAIDWFRGSIDSEKQKVFSIVEGVNSLTFADAHAANVVDVCLAEGELGIGETGSVWVTDRSLGLTAAALFSTDLYLLLDSRKIVDGLHSAYEKIDITETNYGAFYTGPSATADIEAIHITGAQAFTSLTVLLY